MGLVASTWFSMLLRRVERFSSSYGTVFVAFCAWVQQERLLAKTTAKLVKKHAKKMSPAMAATSASIMVLSHWSDGEVSGVKDITGSDGEVSGVEDVIGFIESMVEVEYVFGLVVPSEGIGVIIGDDGVG